MLVEDTLFDHIDKVQMATDRIKNFEPEDGYYVAFSGGKDSIVVLDLVQKAGVKYDAHFNLTSVDPPELIRFVMQHYRYVERHRPEKTMWQLIVEKMMPPTRIVRYCCERLKEGGGKGRTVITGVRWAESNRRRQRKMVESCTKSRHTFYVHPIIDWSVDDVWEYIRENNLPYPSLYDEGFRRIGCIGCPMSTHRKQEFERWPRFEARYKKAFAAAAANLAALGPEFGGRGRNAKLRWKTGEDMFRWWMEQNKPTNEDQFTLFED